MTADFGLVRAVQAQSFGEPGGRTFRLRLVGAASQSASLWIEKEHLGALGLALRHALSEFNYDQEPAPVDITDFPEAAEHDFRVGRIGIGLDPSNRTVVLQMDELGREQDRVLHFRLSLDQSASLAVQLERIIAAGRPVCPLCGRPIDPAGHMCVRSNGHSDEPIPDADSGDGS
jgi:uncharacterized repeat protein (TIGR03847 family)